MASHNAQPKVSSRKKTATHNIESKNVQCHICPSCSSKTLHASFPLKNNFNNKKSCCFVYKHLDNFRFLRKHIPLLSKTCQKIGLESFFLIRITKSLFITQKYSAKLHNCKTDAFKAFGWCKMAFR